MGAWATCCGHGWLLVWAWAALGVGKGGSCCVHGQPLLWAWAAPDGSGGSPCQCQEKKQHFYDYAKIFLNAVS